MTQCVMGGIIRGLGLQFRAFLVAVVCYYLVGVPLAAYLTLGKPGDTLKLKGTWIGIATGSLCVNLLFVLILVKSKWTKVIN